MTRMRAAADRYYQNKTCFFPAQAHEKPVYTDLDRVAERCKAHDRQEDSRHKSHIQHALTDHAAGINVHDTVAMPHIRFTERDRRYWGILCHRLFYNNFYVYTRIIEIHSQLFLGVFGTNLSHSYREGFPEKTFLIYVKYAYVLLLFEKQGGANVERLNEMSEQTPLLQLENVKIKKAGRDLEIFTATLFPGIVYQIQGPNGSGKSTLLDIFAHERKIDEGNIYFEGKSGRKKQYSGKFVKNTTTYIRQDTRVLKQTPMATLNAAIRAKQLSSATVYRSVMGLLESYGLQEIANVKMKDLSSVTRKKIELLTVFLRDSRLVIIDDPAFESMDEHFVRKYLADLKKSVKQDNRTLVLAQAQSLSRYRVIDITLVMHKGHIIRVEKTYQKKSPARKPQNNKT